MTRRAAAPTLWDVPWAAWCMGVSAAVIAGSAALGASHVRVRTAATIFAVVLLLWVVRQEWGSVGVIALPFLVPDVRSRLGLDGSLQLALLTLVLAVIYWDKLGRPRLPTLGLWAVGTFTMLTWLVTFGHSYPTETPDWIGITAFTGLMLGTCLAANQTARMAFGYACLPMALLAIAEVAGYHNPWPELTHATSYVKLDQIPGATRAQSTFGHPLIAGGCLAGAAAIMMQSRTRYCLPVAAVLALGAVSTISRSAVIGLGAAITLSFLVSERRSQVLWRVAVAGLVAIIVTSQIPALSTSITSRFTSGGSITLSFTDQPIRAYALSSLGHDLANDPARLLFGHGIGYVSTMLTNLGTIDNFTIFDNQYVTSAYDTGLVTMVLVGALVCIGIIRAPSLARQLGLPALVAVAAVMFFVDGGYWLSLGFLAWITVGLSMSSDPAAGDRVPAGALRIPTRYRSAWAGTPSSPARLGSDQTGGRSPRFASAAHTPLAVLPRESATTLRASEPDQTEIQGSRCHLSFRLPTTLAPS